MPARLSEGHPAMSGSSTSSTDSAKFKDSAQRVLHSLLRVIKLICNVLANLYLVVHILAGQRILLRN
jgi:hypothetical protein